MDASPADSTQPHKSPISSKRKTAVEAHLTRVAADFVHAINTSMFNRCAYPWTQLASSFRAEHIFAHWPEELDLDGFFEHFKQLLVDYPKYHATATEITANVNETTGNASTWINLANDNFSPGITRYSVGVLSFEGLGDGEWRCVKYTSLPGSPASSGKGAEEATMTPQA